MVQLGVHNVEAEIDCGDRSTLLLQTVQASIKQYLNRYPNESFAINELANNSGLNKKTIKRLLKAENIPTPKTLFALYKEILKVRSLKELIAKCPEIVREELEHIDCEQFLEHAKPHYSFARSLKSDPIKIEIYILAKLGVVHKQAVSYQFGAYGAELLEEMVAENILVRVDKDTYGLSPNAPDPTPESIKEIGIRAVSRFAKSMPLQDHKNSISFRAEGLSEQGLQAWLEIEARAIKEKIEALQKPQNRGCIAVFTFSAIDTLVTDSRIS